MDPLFSYKEGEEEDYFNLEDSEDQLYNFRSSGKGDVHLRGTEDVEILETFEGEEPITEPVDEVAHADVAPAGAATAEAATVGDAPVGVVLGEVVSTEITTTVILVPPGNDHNLSFNECFLYTVSDFNYFADT